jgi:hypothetical protein
MALKSAHIDATLRVVSLSEIFTQDIEDLGRIGSNRKRLRLAVRIKIRKACLLMQRRLFRRMDQVGVTLPCPALITR